MDSVRLACVKPAASVRPEPGSNSPSRTSDLRRLRSERKFVWPKGKNPRATVPNFYFCFCSGCMGMHPGIDLDDIHGKTMLSPALLFSLLFCFQGANALGMYPMGSDTDPRLCVKRLEGASCNANGVQPNSNMGFREI